MLADEKGRSLSHDVPLQKASEASAIWHGGDKARTRRRKKARQKGRSISHDVPLPYGTEAIMDGLWGCFLGLVFGLFIKGCCWLFPESPASPKAGDDGLRAKGRSAVWHAAAQNATSGRQ